MHSVSINASRVTFAMIDAAATANDFASPSTTASHGTSHQTGSFPSTKRPWGSSPRAVNALFIARRLASRMLCASTSSTLPTPTPTATAFWRIRTAASSRSAAVITFESRTPRIFTPAGSATQAATTGPARGPRPASSMPARRSPQRERYSSSKRVNPLRAIASVLLLPFLHLRRLALETTAIEQLRATHLALPGQFDLRDGRRVERERPLDADSAGDLPHGEARAHAAPPDVRHDAEEDLRALLLPLDDAHVHLHRVAGAEIHRAIRLESRLEPLQHAHRPASFSISFRSFRSSALHTRSRMRSGRFPSVRRIASRRRQIRICS